MDIEIKLWYKKENAKRGKTKRVAIGTHVIPFSLISDGFVKKNWFPLASLTEKDRSIGNLNLQLQCSLEGEMLYGLGIPSKTIPFRLKTGDILLFDNSRLLSFSTKIFTRSRWDHVAMVIVLCNTLMMLEANSTDGVQLYGLDDKLRDYRHLCTIGVRRLNGVKDKNKLRRLLDFIYEVKGRPYEKSLLQLFKAVYKNPETSVKNTAATNDDLNSLFCSELIAAAFQRMGLLGKDVETNAFAPKDFATDRFTRLQDGASLGRLIKFKRYKKLRK
eukprot:TRINITY_DN4036_c0_g1_i1.p1 TRINITY_DN4036_c0_g1~~TRINITY_DN4036_c0_g1_i1.p1  ORF type:complete len:274 (+),score=29.25 TRINITY_DN4036_c0_g1_i1:245-1066(+)